MRYAVGSTLEAGGFQVEGNLLQVPEGPWAISLEVEFTGSAVLEVLLPFVITSNLETKHLEASFLI